MVNIFFLHLIRTSPISMCVYCFLRNPCTPLRRPGSVPSWPPRQQLWQQWALPFALSSSDRTNHGLSNSMYITDFSPRTAFMALCWACQRASMPFFYWTAPNGIAVSQTCITLHAVSQPEQRFPSLYPLPTLRLQPTHPSRFKSSTTFFSSYNYVFAQNEAVSRNNRTKKTTLTAPLFSIVPWRPPKLQQVHHHCHCNFEAALPLVLITSTSHGTHSSCQQHPGVWLRDKSVLSGKEMLNYGFTRHNEAIQESLLQTEGFAAHSLSLTDTFSFLQFKPHSHPDQIHSVSACMSAARHSIQLLCSATLWVWAILINCIRFSNLHLDSETRCWR